MRKEHMGKETTWRNGREKEKEKLGCGLAKYESEVPWEARIEQDEREGARR